MQEQAKEFLDGITVYELKNIMTSVDINILDYYSFTEFATAILEKLIINKLKLHQDECIELFKIEHEANCCS